MNRFARRFALAVTLTLVFAVRAKGLVDAHPESQAAVAPSMPAAARLPAMANAPELATPDLQVSRPKKHVRHHVACKPLGFGCLQNG